MADITKITLPNGTSYDLRGNVFYGVCNTAGATAAKTVTISQFPSTLTTGLTVVVYFANKNTVANPTLSINGLAAKAIYQYTSKPISASESWEDGAAMLLTYNGTYWLCNLGGSGAKYTFSDGTNGFTATGSDGTSSFVNVTPSITNNALTTTTISGNITVATAAGISGTVASPSIALNQATVISALGYTPGGTQVAVSSTEPTDSNVIIWVQV